MKRHHSHPSPHQKKSPAQIIFLSAFLALAMKTGMGMSQALSVTGVFFEDRGDTVEVRYHLSGDAEKKYVVTLFLSYDGGRTFTIQPRGIAGDVGRNMRPGANKKIIWRIGEDFPEGLRGERFVFAVEAELQKNPLRWPYYVAGAGIVGGLIVWGANREGPLEPVTGSVHVVIPVEVLKK